MGGRLKRKASDLLERGMDELSDRALDMLDGQDESIVNATTTAEKLRVDIERHGGFLTIGRRVVVPADEIHVVSAHGRTSLNPNNKTEVFGAAAGQPVIYWMNALTEVHAYRTINFLVSIGGQEGISVLDASNRQYNVWALVIAKVDPTKAQIAAQTVGSDVSSIIDTIREATESELSIAAAQKKLEEVIRNFQVLADDIEERVNKTLQEHGYQLVLIKISNLGGTAYGKLVEQANAEITRDATVSINAAELKTRESQEARKRQEAAEEAATSVQGLASTQSVALREQEKTDVLASRQNELDLAASDRQLKLTEANRAGEKRDAELAADIAETTQARAKDLQLKASQADSERLDAEATAAAERARGQKKTAAQADAEAEQIRAKGEADAAGLKAQATIKAAEAERAQQAAPGLAEADVQARLVEIEGQRVAVDKERSLAEVEVSTLRAKLYAESPALLELDRYQRDLDHRLALAELDAKTRIAIVQALAPHIDLKFVLGDPSRVSQIMTTIMSLAYGANVLTQAVPALGDFTGTGHFNGHSNGHDNGAVVNLPSFPEMLEQLKPYVVQFVDNLTPQDLTVMTADDLFDALRPVIAAQPELLAAVDRFHDTMGWQLVAKLPVREVFDKIGMGSLLDKVAGKTVSAD